MDFKGTTDIQIFQNVNHIKMDDPITHGHDLSSKELKNPVYTKSIIEIIRDRKRGTGPLGQSFCLHSPQSGE